MQQSLTEAKLILIQVLVRLHPSHDADMIRMIEKFLEENAK